MKALTENQRELLLAAIDLALNTWDKAPENEELYPIEDMLIKAGAEDWTPILAAWDPRHGICSECGLPAAFAVPEIYGSTGRTVEPASLLRCAVCAANDAADGERVVRITE